MYREVEVEMKVKVEVEVEVEEVGLGGASARWRKGGDSDFRAARRGKAGGKGTRRDWKTFARLRSLFYLKRRPSRSFRW
ncbi:hypothetical protein E2C01_035233 [Portunus trituberculatus]|uniref:Uncharacterized protein n=1 Tax=Portunus trituberculatus TaxID=210409 RepID=A0A5B7F563_PORTR|nr:hypothetical protein [Portunus trituberculatus]